MSPESSGSERPPEAAARDASHPPLAPELAQAALVQLAEGVIIADAAGRVTFVNDAAARLHGVARLDVQPERYADAYHLFTEDGRPYPSTELPLARAVIRGETVTQARWRVRRPDGTEILATGSARPVLDADGRQVGAVLTVRDDSEREAARLASAERDALADQLRQAFEQSPVSTVVYDAMGQPVAANPAFERLWGVGLADVPPGYTALADPQLEAAGVMPLLRRAFGLDGARTADGAGEPVAFPALRYDVATTAGRGRALWTQAHAYPVRDASGAVERVVLTHDDVTAQFQAEGALRDALAALEARNAQLESQARELGAERRRLAEVLAQAPVAVAVVRGRTADELVYELVNARYEEAVTGDRQPVGRRVRDVLPELEDAHLAVLQAVLDTRVPFVANDYRVPLDRDRDGALEDYYFNFVYHPLVSADGEVSGLVAVGTEVTDSVRARREAERARADAEAANRAKGEFLAVMSHELRTPLNAIDGYAELMELGIRGPLTEQQRADLARIRTSQRHLLGLINGVLNYSRIEAGAVRYAVEAVPLAETITTCEALTAPQARARQLALVFHGCDPLLHARADREKVQQIVLNLLSNAVKFTEAGGRVELACEPLDERVAITVTDTGRGIPADRLEQMFEPFVQVDASWTRTQEGVGLGLAISRDLARGMGGDLVARSVPGEGSTFTLTLPRG